MGSCEIRNGDGVLIARFRVKYEKDEFKTDFYTPPDNVFVGRSVPPFKYRDELDGIGKDHVELLIKYMWFC